MFHQACLRGLAVFLFLSLQFAHADDIGEIFLLNDTGVVWSGAGDMGNSTACDAFHPAWQDCSRGRDAHAQSGKLNKLGSSSPNNGLTNGFDFTKISNSGNDLPATAALGTAENDWACTRDNVTGLMWEVKVNDSKHLRGWMHGYRWYTLAEVPEEGMRGGVGENSCNATLPSGLNGPECNTHSYVVAVNKAGLCGRDDWRLPSISELESIVDYGRSGPKLDKAYFGEVEDWFSAWSSTIGIPSRFGSRFTWWVVTFRRGGSSAAMHDLLGGEPMYHGAILVRRAAP